LQRPGVEKAEGDAVYGKGVSYTPDEIRAIFDAAAARKAEAVAAAGAAPPPELVELD
jgi:hypothetical protein